MFFASEDVSSSESYWTLAVSGLIQSRNESTSLFLLAPCFYHVWINLRFFLRVDEDVGFPAVSGCHQIRGFLNRTAHGFLRWAALHSISLMSRSSWGATPCWEFSLTSQSNSGFDWTLKLSVFQQLRRRWQVSIDLFTTSPLLPFLGSVPQSQFSWDGASSPTMRWVASVCFASIMCWFLRFSYSSASPLGSS